MLEHNGAIISDYQGIADLLDSTFSSVSSSINFLNSFRSLKYKMENTSLNFRPSTPEDYNQDFTMVELLIALHRSGNTAVGPDFIHYCMLRHLSPDSLFNLLFLYN